MSYLSKLNPYQRPPSGSLLNLDHPLLGRLNNPTNPGVFVYLDQGQQGTKNRIQGARYAVTTNGTPAVKPSGLEFDGSGTYLQCAIPSIYNASDYNFTFICTFTYSPTATSGGGMMCALTSGWWGPTYVQADYANNKLDFKIYGWSGQHYNATAPANTLQKGKTYSVICTYNGGSMKLFQNGQIVATQTTNGYSGNAGGTIGYFGVGYYLNGTPQNISKDIISYSGIIYGALSDEQAKALGQDPYCFVTKTPYRRYFVPSAAGQTISIAAGAAQFTGNAPTVQTTNHITVAIPAGAAQFTGNVPVVVASDHKTIAIPAGVLQFTGNVPTVSTSADLTVAIAAGAAQFTGNAPTLKTGINPAAGAAQFTGNAPTLDISQDAFVAIPAGSIQFTGNTIVVLTTDHKLVSVPVATLQLTGYAPTANIPVGGDNDTYLQVDPTNPDVLNVYVEGTLLANLSRQNIDINGGLAIQVVRKTAAYTATVRDAVILCDATAGAFSITLPPSADAEGLVLFIKKTDASANAVTIDGDASEQIDGAATVALASQYDAETLVADGVGWSKF